MEARYDRRVHTDVHRVGTLNAVQPVPFMVSDEKRIENSRSDTGKCSTFATENCFVIFDMRFSLLLCAPACESRGISY